MSDIDSVADLLAATHVAGGGVSFQGKSLKLNNANDAKEIIEALKACNDLTFFNLEGNTLGVEAAEAISKALETHPELKNALWKDMFTGRMKTEIPKALEFLGRGLVTAKVNLVELDLSDNAFGPIGVEGLASLLRSPPCYSLQILKLNNNGLGITGGKLLARALLDCHTNSSKEGTGLGLKVLIAGRNRLENEGSTAIAEVLKTMGTLEELCLPQNGIYYKGVTALSEALRYNPNMKILNLNDNTLTVKGAQALSDALPNIKKLHSLNLGDCLLKTKGALLIAEALKANHTNLNELILSANEIGIDGGLALCEAVRNKNNLKTFDMNANHFGEEGCLKIRSELSSMGRLEALADLDEDEGSEDEEEDEVSEEEEEEEEESDGEASDNEEEDGDDDDYEEVDQKELLKIMERAKERSERAGGDAGNESIQFLDQESSIAVNEFFENPTGPGLLAVTVDKILQHALTIAEESYVDQYLPLVMTVASLSAGPTKDGCEQAMSASLALLGTLFEWAEQGGPTRLSLINNALLVHLGLLKKEDKNLKTNWNLEGCWAALGAALSRNYLPKSTTNLLSFFLEKSNDKKLSVIKETHLKAFQKGTSNCFT